MSNIHPDIRPGGLNQRNLVTLLRMILTSLQGICAKLDDDGGVPMTDYEANCITALINGIVECAKGTRFQNVVTESSSVGPVKIVNPYGISDNVLVDLMYDITNCFETLTEQLDADVLTDSTYEALCYTAKFLHIVENSKGAQLGNGTAYYFKPGGVRNDDQLVEWLYNVVDAIETLTEQLDADGTVTDTDYESLWFTNTILLRVENAAGNVVGNTSAHLG